MGRAKARRPATDVTVHGPSTVSQVGKPENCEATSNFNIPQAVAVYDGTVLAGSVVKRADFGFDAYDASGKHVGCFATQKQASRAIPSGGVI